MACPTCGAWSSGGGVLCGSCRWKEEQHQQQVLGALRGQADRDRERDRHQREAFKWLELSASFALSTSILLGCLDRDPASIEIVTPMRELEVGMFGELGAEVRNKKGDVLAQTAVEVIGDAARLRDGSTIECVSTGTVTLEARVPGREIIARRNFKCLPESPERAARRKVVAAMVEAEKVWEECSDPPGLESMTQAQMHKASREITNRLRGKPVVVLGYVDEVEVGMVSGFMTLKLRRSQEDDPFGDRFFFDLPTTALRRAGDGLRKGERVVVTGKYTGNLAGVPCVFGGHTARFGRPDRIERENEFEERTRQEALAPKPQPALKPPLRSRRRSPVGSHCQRDADCESGTCSLNGTERGVCAAGGE